MQGYDFTGEVWRYPGEGGWRFVPLPTGLADELRARHAYAQRAFGSLRVTASLGSTTWSTSRFTDTRSQSLLLGGRWCPAGQAVQADRGEVDLAQGAGRGGDGQRERVVGDLAQVQPRDHETPVGMDRRRVRC